MLFFLVHIYVAVHIRSLKNRTVLTVVMETGTWTVVFTKTFNTKFPSFLFNEQTLRVCPSLNLVLKLASKDYGHCHFHFGKTGFSKDKVKPRKSISLLQVTD